MGEQYSVRWSGVIKYFPQFLHMRTCFWSPVEKVINARMMLGFNPTAHAASSGNFPGSFRKYRRQCSTRFNLLVRLMVKMLSRSKKNRVKLPTGMIMVSCMLIFVDKNVLRNVLGDSSSEGACWVSMEYSRGSMAFTSRSSSHSGMPYFSLKARSVLRMSG